MTRQKTAVVTGGTGGIGAAICAVLRRDGMRVIAADAAATDGPETIRLDVTDAAALQAAFDSIAAQHGGLDVLVNGAGVNQRTGSERLGAQEWRQLIEVNLTSVQLACAAALPHLRQAGEGAIVNIASVSGLLSVPGRSAYTAAKHGVVGLTKALAGDFAGLGIRVNAVAPGMIETPMTARYLDQPEVREQILAAIPAGRIGTPAEVAEAVGFLASARASYISGACLVVDGAFSVEKSFAARAGAFAPPEGDGGTEGAA